MPFYASPLDHTFQSGERHHDERETIFQDSRGSNAIIYGANGYYSAPLEFGNPGGVNAPYVVNGTTPAPYTFGRLLPASRTGCS